MNKRGFVDKKDYNKIVSLVPIVCVDLIFVYKGGFLMGRRIKEPAKRQWFFPGGRVYKGETILNTAIRKAKKEIGLKIIKNDLSFLGVGETIFNGRGIENNRHSVDVVFLVRLKRMRVLNFDTSQHSEVRWFSKIDRNWNPYVKIMLKKAGFKL